MRRYLVALILLFFISGCGLYEQELVTSQDFSNTGTQTYSVLVGAEDPSSGAELEAYFPAELHIHPGDTVIWQQNASEIHTATFSPNRNLPDLIIPAPGKAKSRLMFNPQAAFPYRPDNGIFNPTAYINSGLLGRGQGEAPGFRLTFDRPGRYAYRCIVHSEEHAEGVIVVEDPDTPIASPEQVKKAAQAEIQAMLAQVPQVVQAAQAALLPDEQNADGTLTHHILAGFSSGSIDLEAFFPDELTVRPGEQIQWILNAKDQDPHTITFLNGENPPEVVILELGPSSVPLLLVNPLVADPINSDQPITPTGTISSGLLLSKPGQPATFTLQVGNFTGTLAYTCLIHHAVGMSGTLTITDQ